MLVLESVDGEVADEGTLEARCLCDVKAAFVWPMRLSLKMFERAAALLPSRRAARAEFVAARMGPGRFRGVAVDHAFELNDEFEEKFGRDPLEALINDVEEIMHRELGGYFATARGMGVTTSPMAAGAALRVGASKSFKSQEDLARHRRGVRGGWRPSVRADVSFTVAGDVSKVSAAGSAFGGIMAARGPLVGFSQTVRRVDTSGIPHALPLLPQMALVPMVAEEG